MVHKALVSADLGKISSVGGDHKGAKAAQSPHDGHEIYHRLLAPALSAKGDIQNGKDHHAAQMKGQGLGRQGHAPVGAGLHIAHDLADLTADADDRHNASGPAQRPVIPSAQYRHGGDKRRAQTYPNQVFSCKHSPFLPYGAPALAPAFSGAGHPFLS